MTMVIAALVLSLVFVVGGWIAVQYSRDFGVVVPYVLAVAPGLVGLALAAVAGVVLWIPATTAWAWLPATLSCAATLSMVVYAGGAWLVSRVSELFG